MLIDYNSKPVDLARYTDLSHGGSGEMLEITVANRVYKFHIFHANLTAVHYAIMRHSDGTRYEREALHEAINIASLAPVDSPFYYLPNYWARLGEKLAPLEGAIFKPVVRAQERYMGYGIRYKGVAWEFYNHPSGAFMRLLSPCCAAEFFPPHMEVGAALVGEDCSRCGHFFEGKSVGAAPRDFKIADLSKAEDSIALGLEQVYDRDPLETALEAPELRDYLKYVRALFESRTL